mmetsp:Transcript_36700/g.105195  ORF Transcript_36700/g.105195 Transcript_36700/m.105195 type:complete len:235 (+) Transcript_36700:1612-2316(+)
MVRAAGQHGVVRQGYILTRTLRVITDARRALVRSERTRRPFITGLSIYRRMHTHTMRTGYKRSVRCRSTSPHTHPTRPDETRPHTSVCLSIYLCLCLPPSSLCARHGHRIYQPGQARPLHSCTHTTPSLLCRHSVRMTNSGSTAARDSNRLYHLSSTSCGHCITSDMPWLNDSINRYRFNATFCANSRLVSSGGLVCSFSSSGPASSTDRPSRTTGTPRTSGFRAQPVSNSSLG